MPLFSLLLALSCFENEAVPRKALFPTSGNSSVLANKVLLLVAFLLKEKLIVAKAVLSLYGRIKPESFPAAFRLLNTSVFMLPIP